MPPSPSSYSFIKGRHIHYISRRLEMKAGHIVVCAKLTLPRLPMRMVFHKIALISPQESITVSLENI